MEITPLIAKAEMLIRKPVAEVFEAFVNPDITSKFWFTKGSGRLEAGKREFIVASPSFEYVYNDRRSAYPFLIEVGMN